LVPNCLGSKYLKRKGATPRERESRLRTVAGQPAPASCVSPLVPLLRLVVMGFPIPRTFARPKAFSPIWNRAVGFGYTRIERFFASRCLHVRRGKLPCQLAAQSLHFVNRVLLNVPSPLPDKGIRRFALVNSNLAGSQSYDLFAPRGLTCLALELDGRDRLALSDERVTASAHHLYEVRGRILVCPLPVCGHA